MPPHIACDRHSPPHSAQPCSTGGKTHALRLITWPPTTAFTTTAASLPLTHCPCCRHHRKPQPFRPRPCSCTCCRVLLGVCTVTMCADVCVHKLDQWRSSDSSTDISITLLDFKEGHTTLLALPCPCTTLGAEHLLRDLERPLLTSLLSRGQTPRLRAGREYDHQI